MSSSAADYSSADSRCKGAADKVAADTWAADYSAESREQVAALFDWDRPIDPGCTQAPDRKNRSDKTKDRTALLVADRRLASNRHLDLKLAAADRAERN